MGAFLTQKIGQKLSDLATRIADQICKLNAIDPQAYLASTLTRLVNRHPDQLMFWTYANQVPC